MGFVKMRMLIFEWVVMDCDFWRSFVLLSCDLAVKKQESFVCCRHYVDAVFLQCDLKTEFQYSRMLKLGRSKFRSRTFRLPLTTTNWRHRSSS